MSQEDWNPQAEMPRPSRIPNSDSTRTNGWNLVFLIAGVVVGFGIALSAVIWLSRQENKPTEFVVGEDYAIARKTFRTTLTTEGPAPLEFDEIEPNDSVDVVDYLSGNLKLKAWMSRRDANDRTRKPAVLFLHADFGFGDEDWEMAGPFEKAGFVVMMPMLRGENGLPGHYSLLYNEVDDVLAAATFLSKRPEVNPKRIYVIGHDVGGTLAMLSSMASNRFKACVSISGSPDQPKFAEMQSDLQIPFDPKNELEFRMRSPLAFPTSFKCPARLYFGDKDPSYRIPTMALAEQASQAGKNVVAEEVPGDHVTAVLSAIPLAITFFQEN